MNNIFLFWYQGIDNAPPLVRECVRSWKKHNPDANIHLIHKQNIHDYYDFSEYNLSNTNINIQHYSAILRINLLKKYGGVWSDATNFCVTPIFDWVQNCSQDTEFFCFSNPAKDRKIATWFFYSKPDSYIVTQISRELEEYWKTHSSDDRYFMLNYVFEKCYNNDITFKEQWDSLPSVSACTNKKNGPHFFIPYEKTYRNVVDEQEKQDMENHDTPFFKLNWRMAPESNSSVDYLLNESKYAL